MRTSGVPAELDSGSYLSHYGIRNPWTMWLLRTAPELVGFRPTDINHRERAPRCPVRFCGRRMSARGHEWRCYNHRPPWTLRTARPAPDVKWAPGQPSALSCIGKDVDVEWNPEAGGYVIVEAEGATA